METVSRYTFTTDYYGNEVVRLEDDHIVKSDEEYVLAADYDRLRDLIRRAIEWTPTFPLEASLADEMAEAISMKPDSAGEKP